jgi:hypothetical protein
MIVLFKHPRVPSLITTSTNLSRQHGMRGSSPVSGTNTLWANALWGSSTIAGLNALRGSNVQTAAESFNLLVQRDK